MFALYFISRLLCCRLRSEGTKVLVGVVVRVTVGKSFRSVNQCASVCISVDQWFKLGHGVKGWKRGMGVDW